MKRIDAMRAGALARVLGLCVLVLAASVRPAGPQAPVSRFLFSDPLTAPSVRVPEEPAIARTRLVTVDLRVLARPSDPGAPPVTPRLLELNLFPDVFLTAWLDRVEPVAPAGFVWIGQVSGAEDSHVILVVSDGVLAGSITVGHASYQVRYAGDGFYAISEVDSSRYPAERLPLPVSAAAESSPAEAAPADSGDTFDLLVVYTSGSRVAAGGTSAMNALINLGVTETNTAYANSGIVSRVRLVGTAETNYTETADMGADLQRLQRTSDGVMDEVHALRDRAGADLVMLVVRTYTVDACGIGYLMSGLDSGFQRWAFSVVARNCIGLPTTTFAHELGHNMGCNHAPNDPGVYQGAFSYSFGYKDPGHVFRTVMAYNCTPPSCPPVLQFSSPARLYQGRVAGTATQDNAQSINNARQIIANWRQSGGSAPGAPSNLAVLSSGSTVSLTWTAPATGGLPTTYLVEAGSASGLANLANVSTGSTVTSFSASGVGIGVYYLRVRAGNASGTGPPSNEVQLAVGTCVAAPGAPGSLLATASGSTVTLSWTAPTTGGAPTTYVIEAGSAPGLANLANLVTGSTATSFSAGGVGRGTYYLRIRARNTCGTSPPSNEATLVVP